MNILFKGIVVNLEINCVAKDNRIFLHSTNETELNEMKSVLLELLKGSIKSSKCINLPAWTLSVLCKQGRVNEVKMSHKDIQCSVVKEENLVRFIGPKDSVESAHKKLLDFADMIASNMITCEVELSLSSFNQLANREKDLKQIEKKTNCLLNYSDQFVKYGSFTPRDGIVIEVFLGDINRWMHGDVYVSSAWNKDLVRRMRKKVGKNAKRVCSESGSRFISFTDSGNLGIKSDSVIANLTGLEPDDCDMGTHICDLLKLSELRFKDSSRKSNSIVMPPIFALDNKNFNVLVETVYLYTENFTGSKINHVIFISDEVTIVDSWLERFNFLAVNNNKQTYQWSWTDDKGYNFPYSQAHNNLIENAYSKDCDSIDVALSDTMTKIIFFPDKVNRGQMGIQVDKNSNSVTNVYRDYKDRSVSIFLTALSASYLDNGRRAFEKLVKEVSYPAGWTNMTENDKGLLKVTLDVNSKEFNDVSGRFLSASPSLKIIQIERIQNIPLWEMFCNSVESLREKASTWLFYGPGDTKPEEIFNKGGFNMRHSKAGMWGRGIYFTADSNYSCDYMYRNADNTGSIFLARVALGDSKSLEPLVKPTNSSNKEVYDSIKGCINRRSDVFVLSEDSRAYPEYLITFSY